MHDRLSKAITAHYIVGEVVQSSTTSRSGLGEKNPAGEEVLSIKVLSLYGE